MLFDHNYHSDSSSLFRGDISNAIEAAQWIDDRLSAFKDNEISHLWNPSQQIVDTYNEILDDILKQRHSKDGLDVGLLKTIAGIEEDFVTLVETDNSPYLKHHYEDEDITQYEIRMNSDSLGYVLDRQSIYDGDTFSFEADLNPCCEAIENLFLFIPKTLAVADELQKSFPDIAAIYNHKNKLSASDQFKAIALYKSYGGAIGQAMGDGTGFSMDESRKGPLLSDSIRDELAEQFSAIGTKLAYALNGEDMALQPPENKNLNVSRPNQNNLQ